MKKNTKKWSERFSEPTKEIVKRYTASVNFDRRLALVDIEGSLCLLYTSDAADEGLGVDLGGRRII